MAAEYEGQDRTAEEISQLLYHLQVLMLATRHLARRRLRPPLSDVSKDPMLRIAVPNKGSLSEPAADMLREAGYRAPPRQPRSSSSPTPTTTSSSSTCARATSPSTSAPAPSTPGITGRDLLLDSGSRAVEVMALGFGALDLPVSPPGRARATASRTSTGQRVATQLRRPGRDAPDRARRRRRRSSGSTAPSRPPSPWGRRRHRRRRRDRHDPAQPGPRGLRRADPAQRGRADPPRRAARSRAAIEVLRPPAAGRHHRAQLRDDRLRRAASSLVDAGLRDHPRAGVADRLAAAGPGLGRRARDGARARAPTRSWTSSTTSAPAPSSSPTSPPAGCDVRPSPSGCDPAPGRRMPSFRPRRGRRSPSGWPSRRCWSSAAGAISVPQGDPLVGGWSLVDRLTLVAVGVAIAACAGATPRSGPCRPARDWSCATSSRPAAWPGRRSSGAVRRG